MSGPRLRPHYPSKFDVWVKLTGYPTEHEFWQAMTGKSDLTTPDMVAEYLGTLGYTGTIDDKIRAFLADQAGNVGSTFDNINKFFESAYSVGTSYILLESGDKILSETGDKILKE